MEVNAGIKELHSGRGMPPGIGVGAAPGTLFGSFNPGPSKSSQFIQDLFLRCQLEPAQEDHRIVTGLQEKLGINI